MANANLPTIYRGGALAQMQFMPPTMDVPVFEDALRMLAASDEFETIDESEEVTALDLLRVPMPKEPTGPWNVPLASVDPDTDEERETTPMQVIDGVVLLRRPTRLYWEESYGSSSNRPPDCVGLPTNGVMTGTAQTEKGPGGDCSQCPFAQFGSARDENGEPAAGQACSLRTELYVMVPWFGLPVVVSAPPTSYQALKKYVFGVPQSARRSYHQVITRLGVESGQNASGRSYPKIKATAIALPSAAEAEVIAEVRTGFVKQFKDQIIDAVIPPDPEDDDAPAGEPGTTQNPGRAPTTRDPDEAAASERLRAEGEKQARAQTAKCVLAIRGKPRGEWMDLLRETLGREPTAEEFRTVVARVNELDDEAAQSAAVAEAAGLTDDDPDVPQGGVGNRLPL